MLEMELRTVKHQRAKALRKKPGQLCGLSTLTLRYLPVWSWTSETIFGDSASPFSWPHVPFIWLCRGPKINSLLKERQRWQFFLKERQCQGSASKPPMMAPFLLSVPTLCPASIPGFIPSLVFHLLLAHWLWQSENAALSQRPSCAQHERRDICLHCHFILVHRFSPWHLPLSPNKTYSQTIQWHWHAAPCF